MAKTPKQQKQQKHQEEPEDEAIIMERMKQCLKRLLNTPPETHRQMIERRRREGASKRGPNRKGSPH